MSYKATTNRTTLLLTILTLVTLLAFTLAVTDSLGLRDLTPDEVSILVVYRVYLPLAIRDWTIGSGRPAPRQWPAIAHS